MSWHSHDLFPEYFPGDLQTLFHTLVIIDRHRSFLETLSISHLLDCMFVLLKSFKVDLVAGVGLEIDKY